MKWQRMMKKIMRSPIPVQQQQSSYSISQIIITRFGITQTRNNIITHFYQLLDMKRGVSLKVNRRPAKVEIALVQCNEAGGRTSLNSRPNQSVSNGKSHKGYRLRTDYSEIRDSKNFEDCKHNPGSRKDTLGVYLSKNVGKKELNINSTKFSSAKNQELALFKPKRSSPVNKAASNILKIPSHPFYKYINRKKIGSGISTNAHEHSVQSVNQSSCTKSVNRSKHGSISRGKNSITLKKDKINLKVNLGERKKESSNPIDDITIKTIKKNNKQKSQKDDRMKQKIEKDNRETETNTYGLTIEEEEEFGDRFPANFQKIKLLGRGGFSLVWLGKHTKNGKKFAIKQIISNNSHQTHLKEIDFGKRFFSLGGYPKTQYSSFPGVNNLVKLYTYEISNKDTWIYYERCGNSLGSTLYDIKSEKSHDDSRAYRIVYKPIYKQIAENSTILRTILSQLCNCLSLLSSCQIVHSDIKTENILLRFDENSSIITQVKLIDYGSSFNFRKLSQFSMATPQYMPPQILNYIIHENDGVCELDLYKKTMSDYKNPWVIDVWSLGCVFLQIIMGVPLWMSLPLLVPSPKKSNPNHHIEVKGLFAVKGRIFKQIIQKQRSVIAKLPFIIQNEALSGIKLSPSLKKALLGMLELDYNKRLSPSQILNLIQSD